MSEHQLPPDASRLGLRYRDASSMKVDWDLIRSENEDGVVVHPRPNADVLREYGFDGGHDLSTEEGLNAAIEEFEQSDAYFQWRDGNEPAMNFFWPCEPAYGTSMEKAAQLIADHGGAACLVSYKLGGTEYVGIAMTGGGMDLSHDLAAAYVCAGHTPPLSLMDDALSQIGQMSSAVRPLVVESAARIVESLRWSAEALEERAARAAVAIAPGEDAGPAGPRA
ncbi:hypothetical protein [Methylobacterium radiotolerans]|uniref:hypothetical protein n=1 Tax=Methylobacterium radiotolerans TaxID=31998 RepID=UPI0038CF37D2